MCSQCWSHPNNGLSCRCLGRELESTQCPLRTKIEIPTTGCPLQRPAKLVSLEITCGFNGHPSINSVLRSIELGRCYQRNRILSLSYNLQNTSTHLIPPFQRACPQNTSWQVLPSSWNLDYVFDVVLCFHKAPKCTATPVSKK